MGTEVARAAHAAAWYELGSFQAAKATLTRLKDLDPDGFVQDIALAETKLVDTLKERQTAEDLREQLADAFAEENGNSLAAGLGRGRT